jgi:hypothetical protein
VAIGDGRPTAWPERIRAALERGPGGD